jgi:protein-disulfide isomerase
VKNPRITLVLLALALSVSACGGSQTCPTLDEDALADRVAERVVARLIAASNDHAPSGGGAMDEGNARVDVTPRPGAPSQGSADAPVTIVVFSDFQCPFCSRLLPALSRVRETYGERVRIVFMNYPLPFHEHAQLAAEAGLEVHAQLGDEAFFAFHDLVFAAAPAITRTDLEALAGQIPRLDIVRFRRALDTHVHAGTVSADMAIADASLSAMGTPTSVVNGVVISGAQPFESFRDVIDAALAEAP